MKLKHYFHHFLYETYKLLLANFYYWMSEYNLSYEITKHASIALIENFMNSKMITFLKSLFK